MQDQEQTGLSAMTNLSEVFEFSSDDELGYARSRTVVESGAGLQMDEAYRLAHLPLVSPRHPRIIPRLAGRDYNLGIHERRVFSLVLPIPWDAAADSAAFQRMDAEARSSSFGSKISWSTVLERRYKLHATVCSSLSSGAAPDLGEAQLAALRSVGPVNYEIRGLFSGTTNIGRLYLKLYPERRGAGNPLQDIQRIVGATITDMYLVGLYNLVDDLTPDEAEALRSFLDRWWNVPMYRGVSTDLALLATMDDLAIVSTVVTQIPHS